LVELKTAFRGGVCGLTHDYPTIRFLGAWLACAVVSLFYLEEGKGFAANAAPVLAADIFS